MKRGYRKDVIFVIMAGQSVKLTKPIGIVSCVGMTSLFVVQTLGGPALWTILSRDFHLSAQTREPKDVGIHLIKKLVGIYI